MKIYTKKGDTGTTQLIGGSRVPKHHIRIEAYGTIDELNSYIGLVADTAADASITAQLKEIQDRLFTVGSSLAADENGQKMVLPDLLESDIVFLENNIDAMNEVLSPMKNFILPGGNIAISTAHIARCVCRRAERNITLLADTEIIEPIIIKYINRLSDYLFVLARYIAYKNDIADIAWHPRVK